MTFLFPFQKKQEWTSKATLTLHIFTTTAISTEHSCPLNIFAFLFVSFYDLQTFVIYIFYMPTFIIPINRRIHFVNQVCPSTHWLSMITYTPCTFVCWHSWNGTWDVWEPSPGISKNEGKLYILLQLVHGVWICTNEIHSDSIAMCELMMLFLIATPCLKNFRTVRPNKKDPGTKAFLFAWPGKQWLHHITPLVKSERCYQHVDIEETCLQLLMCWLH